MLLELNHNIQQAHQSIENNSWLAGARYLHGVVTSTRKHINNVDTKPFMEWAHLQSDLSKLIVGKAKGGRCEGSFVGKAKGGRCEGSFVGKAKGGRCEGSFVGKAKGGRCEGSFVGKAKGGQVWV